MDPDPPSEARSTASAAIKRMKLYQHLERVERALNASDARTPCPPETFEALDQLHYEGRDAVDHAAGELGLGPGRCVLDVGSGLGGPARWLAHRHGCRVAALELQPELDRAARTLTARCGLDESVTHLCGDVLDPAKAPGPFDALVSWLVFLHIPDRPRLLTRCRERLRDGGGLYVEDFYLRAPLTDDERRLLHDEVFCSHLVDRERYVEELGEAGFEDVEFEDRTATWQEFVIDRQQRFDRQREAYVAEHDRPTFDALNGFYRTMRTLFAGDRLGGVRVVARAAAGPT
ncbi:methyltransferase domain-containing protein [Wenzhouxiangella sp. XN79A]|uniref:SAM-dependent methyltransferase n=1 Tax=Wenzhouxiangella sp. XN79A TaxID=2724193 RepID=UPI00144ADAA0|nr:class I SAM-dependent methyltransferase [Wenzhouxiangella sp. XN79A]NKI34504.1 methyltransferase domain-containing protein [Wenzhouxiangella sp. XN79A]